MVQKKSRRKGKMSKSRKGSKRLVTRRFKTRRHKTRRPKTRRPKTRRPKARRTTSRRNRTRTYKTRERKKNREKEPEILTMVRNRLKHMKKVLKKQRGGGTTAENIRSAMSDLVDLLYQSPWPRRRLAPKKCLHSGNLPLKN